MFEYTFIPPKCISTSFFIAGQSSVERQIAIRGPNGKYCVRKDVAPSHPDMTDFVAARVEGVMTSIKDRLDRFASYKLEFRDAVDVLASYEHRKPGRLRAPVDIGPDDTHIFRGIPKFMLPEWEGQS